MAISSYVGAEINTANNTFQTWLNRTNDIIGDMGSTVITVGDNNTGNVFIDGVFGANTLYAGTELRGGDANNVSDFVISSNVQFTGANTTITSGEIQFTGNVDINSATSDFNVSTIQTTITSANTIITGLAQLSDVEISGDLSVSGNAIFTSDVSFSANVQSFSVPTGNTASRPDPAEAGMFRFNTELEEFEGYDGLEWGLIGGAALTANVITSNTDLSEGVYVFADTTGGSFNVTLPLAPEAGNVVKLSGKNWENNNLTVLRNGETIEGNNEDLLLDVEDVIVEFVYDGVTWQLFSFIASNLTTGGTIDINDTDANTVHYITFTDTANGAVAQINVSDNDLTFNPDSGTLTTTNIVANTVTANVDANSITSDTVTANTVTANDFNSLSDITFKEHVQPLKNASQLLEMINPVSFNWKDRGDKSYGVIAQELEKVMPELVSNRDGNKYVNYIPMIALLLDGYKELINKIEKLEKEK